MVVPIYNETQSLPTFLKLIDEAKSVDIRFLLVDNGSTDEKVIEILNGKSEYWTSIRTDQNLGFAGGILYGIESSEDEIVGWMPGNLKVDPREVVSVLEKINLGENEVIKANRTGRTRLERVKTFLAGSLQSLLVRERMFDTGGTPTVCHREFVLSLKNPPLDYVFESFLLFSARKMNMKLTRPSIFYGQRMFGQSHWQRGLRSEITLMKKIYISSRSWKND